MTERERKAHLLRRFGLGAGHFELARYPAKAKETLRALLDDDRSKDGLDLDPWRFLRQPDGKLETGSYQLGPWWALRMVLTRTPMTEKLTLFWHDHFALDGDKVSEAATMSAYLQTLRSNGRGKFRDLLKAVMTQGAMLMFLDGHISHKTKPNENLARETFELFTMGEGSGYTEHDIKELARALTGWSMHYMGSYLDEKYEITRKRAEDARMAMSNVCYVPALHDEGGKTILGKSGKFTAGEALDLIASHPKTAEYICGKLWSMFAYPDPPKSVLTNLVGAWKKTDGEIRAVLQAIAEQPEFWSDRCVSQMPKSPADWCVAAFRAMDLYAPMMAKHKSPVPDSVPIEKELRDLGNMAYYLMTQQGLQLLYPPNVAGWNWGTGWIGSDVSAKRFKSGDGFFWSGGDPRPYAVRTAERLKADFKVSDPATLIDAFLAIFDGSVSQEQRAAMISACEKRGGVKALENKDQSAGLFASISRILFAVPEYQLC